MALRIDTEERRRRLAVRHFLAPAAVAGAVEHVAEGLVGLHASDPATVHLAARARVTDFDVSDMERALYDERTLVRVLGMRRTLFVVPTGFAPLLRDGCALPLAGAESRRLVTLIEDSGIAREGSRWLDAVRADVLDALARHGPATASELTSLVPELGRKVTYAPGKDYGGQVGVSTRVLFLLATEGAIVRGRPRGTWVSSMYEWALVSDWAPEAVRGLTTGGARVELAARWLRRFGPAPVADLEWWSGWGKRAVAAALDQLDVLEVDLDSGPGIVMADDLDPTPDPGPWAALLPGLDPTPMAWKNRGWFLGPHDEVLFDRNGNIGPTVWWNGRIVGGWSQRPDGTVAHRLLQDVGRESREAVENQVAGLEQWLGQRRFVTRFRTQLDRELRDG